jgi:hypothetical protein
METVLLDCIIKKDNGAEDPVSMCLATGIIALPFSRITGTFLKSFSAISFGLNSLSLLAI